MSNKNNIVRILAVIIVVFSLIMITNYKNVQNYFNLYLVVVLFISILIIYMFSFNDEVKQSFDDIEILKEISKTTTGQYLEMSKLFNADSNKVSIELRPNLTIYMINEDYKVAIWHDRIGNNNAVLFRTFKEGNDNKFFCAVISDEHYSASVTQIIKIAKEMVFGTGTRGAINVLKNTIGEDAIKDIFKKQEDKK